MAPPKRFRRTTFSRTSRGKSKKVTSGEVVASLTLPPAALKRASTFPKESTTFWATSSTSARLSTSILYPTASTPSFRNSSTRSSRGTISVRMTLAPIFPSSRAKEDARIPAPPVKRRTFPRTENISSTENTDHTLPHSESFPKKDQKVFPQILLDFLVMPCLRLNEYFP